VYAHTYIYIHTYIYTYTLYKYRIPQDHPCPVASARGGKWEENHGQLSVGVEMLPVRASGKPHHPVNPTHIVLVTGLFYRCARSLLSLYLQSQHFPFGGKLVAIISKLLDGLRLITLIALSLSSLVVSQLPIFRYTPRACVCVCVFVMKSGHFTCILSLPHPLSPSPSPPTFPPCLPASHPPNLPTSQPPALTHSQAEVRHSPFVRVWSIKRSFCWILLSISCFHLLCAQNSERESARAKERECFYT
jgi:hypothetical protein